MGTYTRKDEIMLSISIDFTWRSNQTTENAMRSCIKNHGWVVSGNF